MGSPVTITPDPTGPVTITPDQPAPAPREESALSRFGTSMARGAGIVSNEEGANFFKHPIDTAVNAVKAQRDTGNLAFDELKKGKYGPGISDLIYSGIPLLGPTLSHAGHQLESGDIAGGAGTTIGAAIPIALGTPEGRAIPGNAAGAIKPAIAKTARFASDAIDPDITGIISPRLAHGQKALGRLANVLEKKPGAKAIPTSLPGAEPEAQPVSAPSIDTSPKAVGTKLEEALGGKKLEPNVPLRDQMPAGKGIDVPEGHTPVKSSALKSFKYDPVTREFHARATSGDTTYIYGDVAPEQAQAFEKAESKGKAWQDIRQNPLVAKVVNGKRVAVKPTANPSGDLEPILRESVKAIGQKGNAISVQR